MDLNLKRPIIFFDLEATGLNIATDSIVEIAMIKVMPDGSEQQYVKRLNPGKPISAEAAAIHGIHDSDVKDAPTFAQVADEILAFMEECDIAGYNSDHFDLPLLADEFLRLGKRLDMRNRSVVDVQQIFHKMEQRTLAAAHRFYCGGDYANAHSACDDARATLNVFKAQLERYDGVEYTDKNGKKSCPIVPDIKAISNFTRTRNVDFAGRIVLNDKDEAQFNFGQHKGKLVKRIFAEIPSYYRWMMNGDFPLNTKEVITRIYKELQLEKKFNR